MVSAGVSGNRSGKIAMQLLFAQDYSGAYGLVILFLLLGTCAVGIPRFRKVDPLARDKKKSKGKKKK